MDNNQWILIYMSLIRQYESERNEATYMMNNLMFTSTDKTDIKEKIDYWLERLCLSSMKMEQLKHNYQNLLNPPTTAAQPIQNTENN